MNKSKCPACGSARTVKDDRYKGVQTFKCNECGYRFRNQDLINTLTFADKKTFTQAYLKWKTDWAVTLNHRSHLISGKTQYTHRRLRSAMRSLDFYLPYLFTYQEASCQGMPNTNNKIEGTFTDRKKNLNNHSGMSVANRKRFISGFFLALDDRLHKKSENL